eukprot:TRINITY_DN2966_c0_g2_i1.p1 TRINITY_DN2966_c0_g2~~TRINITY_DN2966_c0_g2_i1.p1  ORF type:complete len:611 (+),score=136.12 TRINITY_DN2966_c0_g2_i1:88-1833(+)
MDGPNAKITCSPFAFKNLYGFSILSYDGQNLLFSAKKCSIGIGTYDVYALKPNSLEIAKLPEIFRNWTSSEINFPVQMNSLTYFNGFPPCSTRRIFSTDGTLENTKQLDFQLSLDYDYPIHTCSPQRGILYFTTYNGFLHQSYGDTKVRQIKHSMPSVRSVSCPTSLNGTGYFIAESLTNCTIMKVDQVTATAVPIFSNKTLLQGTSYADRWTPMFATSDKIYIWTLPGILVYDGISNWTLVPFPPYIMENLSFNQFEGIIWRDTFYFITSTQALDNLWKMEKNDTMTLVLNTCTQSVLNGGCGRGTYHPWMSVLSDALVVPAGYFILVWEDPGNMLNLTRTVGMTPLAYYRDTKTVWMSYYTVSISQLGQSPKQLVRGVFYAEPIVAGDFLFALTDAGLVMVNMLNRSVSVMDNLGVGQTLRNGGGVLAYVGQGKVMLMGLTMDPYGDEPAIFNLDNAPPYIPMSTFTHPSDIDSSTVTSTSIPSSRIGCGFGSNTTQPPPSTSSGTSTGTMTASSETETGEILPSPIGNDNSPFPWWIWIIIGVGALLIIVLIIIILIVAIRRRKNKRQSGADIPMHHY